MRNTHHAETTGSRRRRTEVEAEAILARYGKSGLTQRVFARKAGMSVSTLQYWLRRTRSGIEEKPHETGRAADAPSMSLLEVELGDLSPRDARSGPGYEIEMSSGVRLRVPVGFGDGEVRRLLALLKEVR
jgi:transcriptional regulator with XRE-family HTH domain